MAMQLGGGGGVKSDINVTPLVDVMLVLLIIMMIVAPLLQDPVQINLPQTAFASPKPENEEQTVLSINARKEYYVGAKPVPRGALVDEVKAVLASKTEKTVVIRADRSVEYGAVMEAMDSLRAGGIEDMGLITSQPQTSSQAQKAGE